VAIAVAAALFVSAQEKKKEWKDRAEYDLYDAITKDINATARLDHLSKWKSQYPQSDYADVRIQIYLITYQQLNRARESVDTGLEILKDHPNDVRALSAIVGYVFTLVPANATELTPQMNSDLDAAEKTATYLLTSLDTVYAKENKPADMKDDDWTKAKPDMKAFAQKTVGYIFMERKDYEKAQTELTKALQLDPRQGQVSFWLGGVVLAQNQNHPELQPAALYHFARAAVYDGTGSLPAADRKQVQDYLTRVYAQYHGSNDGLDKLLASAKNVPLPPAGFTIPSKAEIDKQRIEAEEAAARANPMLALWKSIKAELVGESGAAYFETNMKDAGLPGGVNGVNQFKGKLVSMTPGVRPKELVLAIENPGVGDVTLKLDSPLAGTMPAGEEIQFEGVARSYTKAPFMVIFEVEKSKLAGWTGKNDTGKKSTTPKKK
jgi:tetratricopeptide (TPR) repeat protein